jgi:hypothetical protein
MRNSWLVEWRSLCGTECVFSLTAPFVFCSLLCTSHLVNIIITIIIIIITTNHQLPCGSRSDGP